MDDLSDGAEDVGFPDGGLREMDQTMVPQPLQIRKFGAIVYPLGVDTEETLGSGCPESPWCYWQSDSWQRFKDLEDSVCDSLQFESGPESNGMDLEPLRRLQIWLSEDEGGTEPPEPPEYARSAGRASSTTKFGTLIDGGVVQDRDGMEHPRGKRMSWYSDLLSDIVSHQSPMNPAASPHVLSNTVTASLWIREQMRDKWKRMYKVALAPQRAGIRRRMRRASSEADRQNIVAEKARLMRRALEQIVADELSEVARALRQTLEAPLREIESLYTLLLAQQHLYLRSHASLSCIIAIHGQQHSALAKRMNETAPFFSAQLDAIDSIFDIGLRTVAATGTRISRVTAQDVPGAEERERESKRRLQDPMVVLGYLAKVEEDFCFLRLWAKTVESSFENIEEELAELAGACVDLRVVEEACVLFAEV